MHTNNRMIIIVALLFCLSCFQGVLQAQERDPSSWQAISISMSENGRYLAVRSGAEVIGTPNGISEIWLYDLENLLLPPRYLAGGIYTSARMFFSPNNLYLAVGESHQLSVFNIENNDIILELPSAEMGLPIDYRWSSFSPDSNHIVTFSSWYVGGSEHQVLIWNIHTGKRIHSLDAPRPKPEIFRAWLSPDWSQYVKWSEARYPHNFSDDTIVYDFDIEQGLGQTRAQFTSYGQTGAFSPDGSLFAFATNVVFGEKVALRVYETSTWALKIDKPTDIRNCNDIPAFDFSHDNSLLVFAYSCTYEDAIIILDVETGEFVLNLKDSETFRPAFIPQFTRNDEFLIGSKGFRTSVWNIEKDLEFTEYRGEMPTLHPNSELMATIGPDGNVWLWNIKSRQLLMILPVLLR